MKLAISMDYLNPSTVLRKAREYSRKLWVRVALMGLLALVALGATQLIEDFIPKKIQTMLHGAAADTLLMIIANAMLAVTTFSLTVMTSVYRSSSTQWSPRVHRLIVEDRTTQNTLAVFIGAYVYSLIAIIMRQLGIFTDDRAFVLFVMTVVVLAIIVTYLIRWVLHLQTFGSLIDSTRQIEDVTTEEFRYRLDYPCLGAHALGDAPEDAIVIRSENTGYVQQIYPEALDDVARAHGVEVFLTRPVGSFVFQNEPLVSVARRGTPADPEASWDDLEMALRADIIIGDLRTFDQDPRFGLVVMGEVASKALSPGVNDPGTAIDVITRIGRILSLYRDEASAATEVQHKRLYVTPLDPGDLLEDGFGALARDGAAVLEVQQRLQKVLAGLMRHPDDALAKAARACAEVHLERALSQVAFHQDRKALMAAARSDVRDAVEQTLKKDQNGEEE